MLHEGVSRRFLLFRGPRMDSAIYFPLLLAVIAAVTAELEWKFTKFPEPVTALVGDEVAFECAVNVPGERLAWRWKPVERPDESWKDAEGSSDREKITTRLVVTIDDDTESALYQCVVWYGAISLASDPARLTIARIDLSRNSAERRVILAPLYNTVVLHCKEPVSEPPAVLTWRKELGSGRSKQLDTPPHGVLVIHNATAEDSGTYSCSATNELSGQEMDLPEKTYLKVQHEGIGGVRFLETEEYVGQVDSEGVLTKSVPPGGALRLWCGAVATPPPRVTWSKDNEQRNGFRHDYDLVVQPFTTEDEGFYSCEADGIRRSWKVIALQAPSWDGAVVGVNVSEGDSAVVACGTPIGQPPPTIHWMLNAEPIITGKEIQTVGPELHIARAEKRHAGAVQCFACNALGCAHDAALLTVVPVQISDQEYSAENAKASHIAYQPLKRHNNRKNPRKNKVMVPPSRPNVTRMSDESVMVSWSNSSVGMPIQIFKVQFREVTNSSNVQWHTATSDIPPYIHSYEVDQLIPDRYYKFRIAAVYSNQDNKLGRSSPKFYLQRGGIKGPRAPELTSAEPISSTSVRLNWTWSSGGGIEAEGFYIYYRAVSSAGKYEKVTVGGGASARSAELGHLAPDTAYELKLQSYTAQAPSDFSSILVAKTLRSATAPGPTTEPSPQAPKEDRAPGALVTAGGALGATALLVILIVTLLLCRRARRPSANKKGSGPESSGANGYIPAKVPITITANPMHAESGDGGAEMSFLHNNNCGNTGSNDDTLPRTRKNGPTTRQYV
ncbi:interference hedgehog-like isoform X2 [Choristoneura fumiferana]|uniref:interference hedgehog-like isoform X2 n=1 Tax=Choristoneura fumiferana TaxID=7141 RepID=UPI003D1572F6